MKWIPSEYLENLTKGMKDMFDFAASNRDAAALRASARLEVQTFKLVTRFGYWTKTPKRELIPSFGPNGKAPF